MNYKDVEQRIEGRLDTVKKMTYGLTTAQATVLLDNILADLRKAMYDPANPESDANTLGKCVKCGQYLPRSEP